MNKNILAIILIINTFNLFSQNTQNPINRGNDALTGGFLSDFGPRFVATGSKFHFGLDYTLTQASNLPAYTVEAGNITYLPRAINAQHIEYVQVGNWRYMHALFGQSSDALWQLKLDNKSRPVLIIRSNANTPIHVYVESSYSDPTYTDNGITLNIEKTIGIGEIIFRPNSLNHLHLDRGNLVFINPLSFLPRPDVNSPATTVRLKYNNANIATAFPSNNIYGNVIIESEVDYQDEKDLDNVIIQLVQNNTPTDLFAWHYTGANHIVCTSYSTGASNTPQYNIRQIRTVNTIRTDTSEGIFPRDGAGLDIFKYHFNSQQTNAGSTIAKGFRYRDGQYTIRVTATDLTGHNTPQDLVTIIDNLLPYIEKVEVRKNNANGDLIYSGQWNWNGTALSLSKQNPVSATDNDDLYVKITASEPMTNLSLSFLSYNNTSTTSINGDDITWEFTIPKATFVE